MRFVTAINILSAFVAFGLPLGCAWFRRMAERFGN